MAAIISSRFWKSCTWSTIMSTWACSRSSCPANPVRKAKYRAIGTGLDSRKSPCSRIGKESGYGFGSK